MGIGSKLAEPNLALAQIVGPIPINALMEVVYDGDLCPNFKKCSVLQKIFTPSFFKLLALAESPVILRFLNVLVLPNLVMDQYS
ncbi:MAG: hypothetical protein EZS28_017626 [Streblomastix strix]|uniref:Uncharacterized protein n=1 Tax=Streblomastix strix TaxID=222440 RepID=A0A5J4VXF2_9EUKA|nr:MAG: hypothetical protein EZS28_017626 [Streblomastix strix]